MSELSFSMLPGECWWGGCIIGSENMPFDETTVLKIDLENGQRTQTAPLFLSSKGRFVWSEEPYVISFDRGKVTASGEAELTLDETGTCLREAYLNAMRAHFPFEENIHTPREYYEHPMFNTWMELIKNQNERDIVAYAEEVVANGCKPGLLIIDGGWQKCQGVWEFNPEMWKDPKGTFARLHELGFTVMIWASPFICSEGDHFLSLSTARSSENFYGVRQYNHLLRNEKGEVTIQKWWSGFGAIHNFCLPDDCAEMDEQLHKLMELGVDGFKFDGGAYRPDSFLNGKTFYGGYKHSELNEAWVDFGRKYRFHEFKDTWKAGGKQVMQRLFDKSHSWDRNGINCLIPNMIFAGLIGSPFICPDMVGGGEWTAFVYGKHNEELFARMAETSALCPMMQFSSLPWRHLSEKTTAICKNMAELHERMYPEIDRLVADAEKTGEPIVRSLEYQYPGEGYERVNDQFMLGEDILVAPVVTEGAVSRVVRFPEGAWEDENGVRYEGKAEIEVPAPIDVLPWFRRVK